MFTGLDPRSTIVVLHAGRAAEIRYASVESAPPAAFISANIRARTDESKAFEHALKLSDEDHQRAAKLTADLAGG